ncbi:hypothetical protein SAMN02745135_01131 [Caloranaerobacter azorensis DSM 13643]|uniref:Uncharacterized protein n=1 Tax=Caloranaerobacter azorensis DSM 13643 TaxID=1121264 RepID=A0A1M5TTQ7_9FIRM|nr:hypothetical protein [Caloranaerobacter azorensis]SHH54162.1 hypothetical protein SAMN02745135_01131 [Caloranaerobacter azorensis DSM 13643]
MVKHLWELSLNQIPLAWSKFYEDSLLNYPEGKYIEIKTIDGQVFKTWVNPVQYKNLIEHYFNKFKIQAKDLLKNQNNIDLKDFIQQLVDIDVALYNLLFEWAFEKDSIDENPRLYNPYTYFSSKQYYNYNFYFSPIMQTSFEETYAPLRIFNQGIPIKYSFDIR